MGIVTDDATVLSSSSVMVFPRLSVDPVVKNAPPGFLDHVFAGILERTFRALGLALVRLGELNKLVKVVKVEFMWINLDTSPVIAVNMPYRLQIPDAKGGFHEIDEWQGNFEPQAVFDPWVVADELVKSIRARCEGLMDDLGTQIEQLQELVRR